MSATGRIVVVREQSSAVENPDIDGISVRAIGAAGSGAIDDSAALTSAHAAGATVFYDGPSTSYVGTYGIGTTTSLGTAGQTTHRFARLAKFYISAGRTLTLRGRVQAAPDQRIKDGPGTLLLPDMDEVPAGWLGATPTAGVNNKVAIAEALAATGRLVSLLAGTYEVRTWPALVIPKGKSLRGAGVLQTTIDLGAATDVGIQLTSDVTGQPTAQTLSDMKITAPGATAPAVRLVGGTDLGPFLVSVQLRRLWFYDCARTAIDATGVVLDASAEDVQFTQCCTASAQPVVVLSGGTTWHFSRCYWGNNRNASNGIALHVTGGDGVWLDKCVIESSGKAVVTVNCDLFLEGVHTENCYEPMFTVDGAFSAAKCWIAAVPALGSQDFLDTTAAESVSIDGCDFWNFGAADLLLTGSPPKLWIGANRTEGCNAAFVAQLETTVTSVSFRWRAPTYGEFLQTKRVDAGGGVDVAYLSATADVFLLTSTGAIRLAPTTDTIIYSAGGDVAQQVTDIAGRSVVGFFYPGSLTATQFPSGDYALFLGTVVAAPSAASPPVSGALMWTTSDGTVRAMTPTAIGGSTGVAATIAPRSGVGSGLGTVVAGWREDVTETTDVTLTQAGTTDVIPDATTGWVHVEMQAVKQSNLQSARWDLRCRVKRIAGTLTVPAGSVLGGGVDANADADLAAVTATLTADDTAKTVRVSVVGVAATDISWHCSIRWETLTP